MSLKSLKDFHAAHDAYKDRAASSKHSPEIESLIQGLGGEGLRNPLNAIRDIGVGLGNAGQNIAKTFYSKAPQVNMEELIGPENPSIPDKLLQGVAQYAPFGAAGGASLAGQVAAGGAYGYSQSDDNEQNALGLLPNGRGGSAFQSALINALTHGAAHGAEAARPSKMFRGNLSDAELQQNLDITKGTETGLGDVVGSPFLKRQLENVLPNTPFSGASNVMQRNAELITNKGQTILDKLGGNLNPETQSQDLQDALKKAAIEARKEKEINFSEVNKEAEKIGLNVGREKFSNEAKSILADIEESPELKDEFPAELLSSIKKYAENKEGNSLKLTDIFRGKIGDKAHEFYQSGKKYESGLMTRLKNALEEDRDSAISSSGNNELKSLHEKAMKNYKENYAQFEDPDIVKFTRKGGDADLMLSHFLRTGKANDRANLMQKLSTKLEDPNLIAQMHLSKAIENGELNPLKLRTLYHNLGKNQKKALIPDASLRKEFDNYTDLVGKNAEHFQTMNNPKTGQRNADVLNALMLGGAGAYSGGGIGGLAAPLSAILGGKIATKALTSEKVRESLIKAMLENKTKFAKPGIIGGSQALGQALKYNLK